MWDLFRTFLPNLLRKKNVFGQGEYKGAQSQTPQLEWLYTLNHQTSSMWKGVLIGSAIEAIHKTCRKVVKFNKENLFEV